MILMLIFLSIPATADEPTVEQTQVSMIDTASKAVVPIVTYGFGSATGFYIAPNLILTNQHVIENTTGFHKPGCENKVIAQSEAWDIAIIQTECTNNNVLKLADKVTVGQDAFIIGFPKGLNKTVTSGVVAIVKDNDGERGVYVDANVFKGSSGSPVLNSKGEVIAIVYGKDTNTDYFAVAVHLTEIKEFLRRKGITL